MKSYNYFNEDYFQDGSKAGTAYHNYKVNAMASPTFFELAMAIREVFRPRRVLDVGCATGTTVRHLNEFGCEAHGIDVSDWAVQNAEHRNVLLASADDLPFPDRHFDLVISCHALEHLPDDIFLKALAEITRVSSAFQFHMLPMVGTPPYAGDAETVRNNLRKDPTHNQLQPSQWWLDQFQFLGHVPVETCILLKHDTASVDLSMGQFILKKGRHIEDGAMLQRVRARNQSVYRSIRLDPSMQDQPRFLRAGFTQLSYKEKVWKDAELVLSSGETIDLTDMTFHLGILVEGSPCELRFAAGQDIAGRPYASAGELMIPAKTGLTVRHFTVNDLRVLRGNPNYTRINHLAVGGANENAEVSLYLTDQNGNPVAALSANSRLPAASSKATG